MHMTEKKKNQFLLMENIELLLCTAGNRPTNTAVKLDAPQTTLCNQLKQ